MKHISQAGKQVLIQIALEGKTDESRSYRFEQLIRMGIVDANEAVKLMQRHHEVIH